MKAHSCLVDGLKSSAPGSQRFEVSALPGGLEIRGPAGERESLQYGDIDARRGGADGSVWILSSKTRGITIYVDSQGLKETIVSCAGEEGGRFAALERRQRRFVRRLDILAYALVLLPFVLVAALVLLFPLIVDKTVAAIPAEWERELGAAAASSVLSETEIVRHPDIDRLIAEIAARFERAGGPALEIRIAKNEQVNAFALPGGHVVVNLGLIEASESPEEVAGILAHEAQHVALRHGLKGVVRSLGLSAVFAVFSGSVPGSSQAAEKLLSLKFDRNQETEADLRGVDLLVASGIDPAGMRSFFAKLAEQEGAAGKALAFLSTHPASADRMDALEDASRGQAGRAKPFESDFEAARSAAKELLGRKPS